jgi:protein TonB
LKLNNYIIISLLTHLLLLGILIAFLPEMNAEISSPVFNVDVVGPVIPERIRTEEEKTIPQTPKIPVKPRLPIFKKPVLKDILSEPPPKTMFGEGADSKASPETMPKGDKEAKTIEPGKSGRFDSEEEMALNLSEDKAGSPGIPLKPKSFLFDRETIEKYAQKKAKREREKGLTFDAPELLHRGYMRMLKDKIESIWRYPEEAARRGISGDLYITFYIHRDGKLGEVKLVRTSGYRELDTAAMKALRDAEPFWLLPEDWEKDTLEIKGHFIYILGDTYIM